MGGEGWLLGIEVEEEMLSFGCLVVMWWWGCLEASGDPDRGFIMVVAWW